MCRSLNELSNPLTGRNTWRNRHGNMDVRFYTSDLMNKSNDAFAHCSTDNWLKRWRQQGLAVFNVPVDVEIDLAVIVT